MDDDTESMSRLVLLMYSYCRDNTCMATIVMRKRCGWASTASQHVFEFMTEIVVILRHDAWRA